MDYIFAEEHQSCFHLIESIMSKKKGKHELKVIFDTNVIYTGSSSDLFKEDIVEIITTYSNLVDLEIKWYLPETVIGERRFQMNKKGKELLPPIIKLEKLLGHNLNITEEIISSRIDEAIEKQIKKNNILEIKIDPLKINWNQVINNSIYRKAPFEDGEKEKGFRDALIIECIQHLIDQSPSSTNICRLAFLSNDILLIKAIKERFDQVKNFRLCSSTDELINLINILTSEIKEELINAIKGKASELFFTKGDTPSIYNKESIPKQISEKFSEELKRLPENTDRRENGQWWIYNPVFIKKVNQRIYWKTLIEIDCKAFTKAIIPSSSSSSNSIDPVSRLSDPYNFQSMIEKIISNMKQDVTKEGKTKFEIFWSVTITTARQLKNPKIDEIKYLETIWK